jgi:hypothetical protein
MALISSGWGIGVGVGMAVAVEVDLGVRVGAGVKVWVGGAVGDESDEAELVLAQAERMRTVTHAILINLFFSIVYFFLGFQFL